jgi:chromosome segregation ATPase
LAELLIPDAARALGISEDTVRRHLRLGRLAWRKDAKGRYLIEVGERSEPTTDLVERAELARAVVEIEGLRDQLMEIRTQRTHLHEEIGGLRRQLTSAAEAETRAARERAELRQLLATAQQQVSDMIEERQHFYAVVSATPPRQRRSRTWRWWPFGCI